MALPPEAGDSIEAAAALTPEARLSDLHARVDERAAEHQYLTDTPESSELTAGQQAYNTALNMLGIDFLRATRFDQGDTGIDDVFDPEYFDTNGDFVVASLMKRLGQAIANSGLGQYPAVAAQLQNKVMRVTRNFGVDNEPPTAVVPKHEPGLSDLVNTDYSADPSNIGSLPTTPEPKPTEMVNFSRVKSTLEESGIVRNEQFERALRLDDDAPSQMDLADIFPHHTKNGAVDVIALRGDMRALGYDDKTIRKAVDLARGWGM